MVTRTGQGTHWESHCGPSREQRTSVARLCNESFVLYAGMTWLKMYRMEVMFFDALKEDILHLRPPKHECSITLFPELLHTFLLQKIDYLEKQKREFGAFGRNTSVSYLHP